MPLHDGGLLRSVKGCDPASIVLGEAIACCGAAPGPVQLIAKGRLDMFFEGGEFTRGGTKSPDEEVRSQLVHISCDPPIHESAGTDQPPARFVAENEPFFSQSLHQVGGGRLADARRFSQSPDRSCHQLGTGEESKENLVAPGAQATTLARRPVWPSPFDVSEVVLADGDVTVAGLIHEADAFGREKVPDRW